MCLSLYVHAYVREVFYLGLLSVYSVCVCVNIRVVWSGFGPPGMIRLSVYSVCVCVNIRVVLSDFGPPGMSMQNLSTFHRSFILVLVLAQYSQ